MQESDRIVARNVELMTHTARTHARLRDLQEMAPGPTLLSALLAVRHLVLDTGASIIINSLWARQRSWEHAQAMVTVIDILEGPGEIPGLDQFTRRTIAAQEIADINHISRAAASDTVDLAYQVLHTLPQSWEALNSGGWSLEHLKALAGATEVCAGRLAEAVDAIIVPLAVDRGWTPATIRHHARDLIIRLDPDGAAERAAETKANADVTFEPGSDDSGTIIAHGDAITTRQMFDTINARAAQLRADGDPRPLGPRRLAAIAEFILGHDTTVDSDAESDSGSDGVTVDPETGEITSSNGRSAPPRWEPVDPATRARRQAAARRRGEAVINIDLATVLGENHHPAHLHGYGPISPATARAFAKDATWRRLVTDPITGDLHHLDTHRYLPTEQIRRWVTTRDRTCQFTGCNRPARQCQLDHRIPHGDRPDQHGPTCICNLQPLCLTHHQLKTKKWYSCTIDHLGVTTWYSPNGFTYTHPRTERYDLPPIDPPDDWPDRSEPDHQADPPTSTLDPPYPGEPLPPEPPLTDHEYSELLNALEYSWSPHTEKAYNLLAAANLLNPYSDGLDVDLTKLG